MKGYILTDESEAELVDALVAHSRRWGPSGRDLHAEFLRAFDAICRNPSAFPTADHGARMYAIPPTPFVIYYADLPSFVWIVAISHGRRRPGYWRRRKPPRV